MTPSQVIKSIKTNTKEWSLLLQDNEKLIMTNDKGFFFIRYNNFKGFKLLSVSHKVEMNYEESEVVAQQLWMYLVNVIIGI